MNFDFKKFTDIGNVSDPFKNPGSGIGTNSIRTPSADDLTTIFTDIKTAVIEFLETMMSGAKNSTIGASFMENASQILGLAVIMLGVGLYIQIQIGNENASTNSRNVNKYATSIADEIDMDKPSSKISKKIKIEMFTNPNSDVGVDGSSYTNTNTIPNPHDPPELATRKIKRNSISIANIGENVENTVISAVSTVIPNGPSKQTRDKLKEKSASCKSTDEFCKHNHDKLEKVCGDIKSQNTCSEKCCCGWVKFSNDGNEGSGVGKGVLNSLGISPDGKCVPGNVDGPEFINGQNIDYYYYMGECMKGVCKPKRNT
jgi:hypothetical protein